jgi:hypothetical protein
MHPKDNEVYPIGTVVRIKKTGVFAIIRKHGFLKDGKNFLHYLREVEEKEGLFALYHDDIEVESLPSIETPPLNTGSNVIGNADKQE